jgi:hypothetical protein
MNEQHANTADQDRRLWTAYDIAAEYGYSVHWAWDHVRRWIKAGRLEVVRHERLTWARLFDREQVLALCTTDGIKPNTRRKTSE